MTLRQNLIDRSAEIKFLLEKELRALDAPCSLADMTRRVGSSRLPIEKHLANLLQLPEFADLSLVKIGTYDVLYRKVIDNRAHEHLKAKLEAAQASGHTAIAQSQDAQSPDTKR